MNTKNKYAPHGSVEICLLCKCSLTGDKTCSFSCACHDKPEVGAVLAQPISTKSEPCPVCLAGGVSTHYVDALGNVHHSRQEDLRPDVVSPALLLPVDKRVRIAVSKCADCGRMTIWVNRVRQDTEGTDGHGSGKCSGSWETILSCEVKVV
jgi:hypothetical protein